MRRGAGALLAALVIGAGLGALVGAGPAAAGGWAVTVIDPLPDEVRAGQKYEVNFWVLQHGTHPYNWSQPASIGAVGLTLSDGRGTSLSFPGRALPEPAHYATTIAIPHDARWRVTGVQGIFASYHVGTLTVPGTLEALGVPAAPSPTDLQTYWPGPVRPPVLQVDRHRDPYAQEPPDEGQVANGAPVTTAVAGPPAVDAVSPTAAADRSGHTGLLAVAIGGAALLLGLTVAGRRWWIRRRLELRP